MKWFLFRTCILTLLVTLGHPLQSATTTSSRAVQAANLFLDPNGSAIARITLASQGNENALGFTVDFDPGALRFDHADPASTASGAILNVNASQASSGHVGIASALSAGQTFPAGSQPLADLKFIAASDSAGKNSQLTFSDAVISREVSDANANVLSADYLPGSVTINSPPSLSDFSDQSMNEESSLQVPFSISDRESTADQLTVTPHSSNQTLLADGNIVVLKRTGGNRILSLTPFGFQIGTAAITVQVSDGRLVTSKSFNLTVKAINHPPSISPISDVSTDEDVSTSAVAFTIVDRETPASQLTLTKLSSNEDLVPNSGIVLTGTDSNRSVTLIPNPNHFGTATITLTVSDGSLTASSIFHLTVRAVNQAPKISAIADQTIDENTSTTELSFSISDRETAADNLILSGSSSNKNLVPDGNITLLGSGGSRRVKVRPATNHFGATGITISVSDGSLTTTRTFQLIVRQVNQPPTITAIPDQVINEDTSLGPISFSIGDLETPADQLQLSASSSNSQLVPNSAFSFGGTGAQRTISVTPATHQFGTATIRVSVNDGSLTTSTEFRLTVKFVNHPPTITSIPDQTINENTPTKTLDFAVDDVETPPNNLKLDRSSSNETLIPNNNIVFAGSGTSRRVIVIPAFRQTGVATITITVSDGELQTSTHFQVTVQAVNTPPVISSIQDQTTDENTAFKPIAFRISDAETAANDLKLTLTSSDPVLFPAAAMKVTGDGTDRALSLTPAQNLFGSATITIQVSDGSLSAQTSFQAVVKQINQPPQIQAPAVSTVLEETPTAIAGVSITDIDAAGGALLVVLNAKHGRLQLGAVDKLQFLDGTNNSSRIVVAAKLADLNSALAGLTYRGNDLFTGTDELGLEVNDQGHTGGGGAKSDRASIALTVTAINHPPKISVVEDKITPDGVPITVHFKVSDVETADDQLIVTAHSSNQDLLSDKQITLPDKGGERTAILNPTPGKTGVAQIVLTVGDPQGATGRASFNLTVTGVKPVIKDLSPSREVLVGEDVKFTVVAIGTPPLQIRWLAGGKPISGETSASLELKNVTTSASGEYQVIVSNAAGSVTSHSTFLTVRAPVEITSQPQDQIALGGSTIQFVVEAKGSEPIRYQWRFNGAIIPSATKSVLSLKKIGPTDAGIYSVDVSNPVGRITSKEARLIVNVAPVIRRQPQSRTVPANSDVSFVVDATGTELTYRWQFNGNDIPGETSSSLRLQKVQPDRNGKYRVKVQNVTGEVLSDEATLTVLVAPVITGHPQDITVKEGDSATLTVQATGTDLKYQWYFGGKPITGADQAAFTIPKTSLADDGPYHVNVINPAGTAQSNPARISVSVPPTITQQPRSRVVVAGANVDFEVVVSGTAPLTYQWSLNGNDISGATLPKLTLRNVTVSDAGNYTVLVSNFAGSAASQTVALTVRVPITITKQPADQTAKVGDSVAFTVVATGSAPISYQWFFKGTPLAGEINPTLTRNAVQLDNAGPYHVVLKNAAGSKTSSDAVLTVNVPVTIVTPPVSKILRAGETARFFVRVNGTAPFSYQWFFNGTALSGETEANLVVPEITAANQGQYTVEVKNVAGSVTSQPAQLTVLSAPTVTLLPAVQTAAPGSTVTFTADAGPAGQGPFTFQWLLNGVTIPGATSQSRTLSNLKPSDSGSYSVVVANTGGAATSDSSLLVVLTQALAFSDSFAGRPLLTAASGSAMGGNTNATAEAGEPRHAGHRPRSSVWFSWRAPSDGVATFDTRGSGFDTILAVYSGTVLNALSPIAFDEDSGGFLTSSLTFNAESGKTYQFAIDGAGGATGHIVVNWSLQASAVKLPVIITQPLSQSVLVNKPVTLSVVAQGQATLSYQWFRDGQFIPNGTNATFAIDKAQPSDAGNYVVRVTSGTPPNQASIDSAPADLVVNLIETGDEGPNGFVPGKFSFLFGGQSPLQRIALEDQPRPRGSVARGFTSSQVFSTKKASKEPGEPNHCGIVGGASVWSLFQPSTNGMARINTDGSDFDTILAVYTGPGTDFKSLVPVACDDNSGANGKTSLLTFPVTAGTTYFVVVDGVGGARGTVQLTIELARPPVILQQPTIELIPRFKLENIAPAQSFTIGSDVKLSVVASNPLANTTLFYQWKKNGIDLPGATSPTLILKNVQSSDFGDYSVDISNFAGIITSQSFLLTIATPPVILTPPQNQTVAVGDSAVFSVTASSSDSLTYQWQKDGLNIRAANNSTFTVNNVQTASQGTYTVIVQNSAGSVQANATLTVESAPTITAQPQSQSIGAGDNVTLTVTASGSALSYQWRFKGVNIPGATNPTLTLSTVQPSNAGDYTVVIANSIAAVTSNPATVSINVPILISQQPKDQTAVAGSAVTFSVVANGTPPLQFLWQANGKDIPGQTTPTLTLNSVQAGDAGNYLVRVSNQQSSILSATAALTVTVPPAITQQPQDQNVVSGSNLSLSVAATGTAPLRFQWRLQGVDISGAAAATLSLANVNSAQAGTYTVLVSNDAGAQLSSPAVVSLNVPLKITQQPQNQAAAIDSTVSFSVAATGSAPLTYQWRVNGTNILNATNSTVILNAVQFPNAGSYVVIVSNASGSVTSEAATLTVSAKEPLQIKSGAFQAGLFHLQLTGPIGPSFTLQSSSDLITWVNVTNVTFTASTLEVIDTPAAQPGNRFYRIFSAQKQQFALNTLTRYADGQFVYELSQAPAGEYQIQASSDLTHWEPIHSINRNGAIQFSDPAANSPQPRFYRAARMQ